MFALIKPLCAGALCLSALAFALAAPASESAQPGTASAEAVPDTFGADAQIVVKDGATGKLRAATAEEAQALHQTRSHLRNAALKSESHSHWSGARGARVTDDFMNFSVVVKRADGTLVELCVDGAETTATVVRSAPQFKPATLPTE